MEVDTFDQWMETLAEAFNKAKAMGMPDQAIKRAATQLGDFLASKIEPDIPENKLLKSLWEIGDDREKEALANMVVKLVQGHRFH